MRAYPIFSRTRHILSFNHALLRLVRAWSNWDLINVVNKETKLTYKLF